MWDKPNSVVEAFLQNCEKNPTKLCFEFEGQTLSYSQLCEQASRFGQALVEWGLEPRDRVALFLENCPEFVISYLGCHLAGAVVVLVNSAYRQVELRHILNDATVRICVTDLERLPELNRIKAELATLEKIITVGQDFEILGAGVTPKLTDYKTHLPKPDDLAIIAYTSGTTGRSKGAMLLQRNLLANIQAVCTAWHWTAEDCLLLTLPLFHAHGLMVGIHGTLLSGASALLYRRFEAAEVYSALVHGQATLFFGVPTMYSRLLTEAAMRSEKPAALRLYVSGSAALSVQTFTEFKQVFGQTILERYGMTETIMNLTNPYLGERRPGTVGQPFPGQAARIVDVRTRQPLPPEIPGEIEVRGPHVFKGYWQNEKATADSLNSEGWFRTGDLGYMSADSYYTINGRASELIISGGYNVYPREVEELLQECAGVAEVAIFGLPDADLGEQVVAAVVRSDPTLTADELVAYCRNNLAAYKKPRQVFFVESLPRNALGKIQKHLLRQQVS
jgi:malonyl-CoA/methylmalonyl-CoA synthetase